MPKTKRTFLCCYCGAQINGSEFNIERHEKIHKKTIKKIECAHKGCGSTFKEKSDYYRHWMKKHSDIVIPDGFKCNEQKTKPYRLKYKNKHGISETSTVKSNDFLILNNSTIEKDMDITLCTTHVEPFFGKLIWNDSDI